MYLLPYASFSGLRIRDFYPEDSKMYFDPTPSLECAIGYAAMEGYPFTYFAWLPSEPLQTAEISLDFRNDCPASIGEGILQTIGLPLKCGMSLEEVEGALGAPEHTELYDESGETMYYTIGDDESYKIVCNLTTDKGLISVLIYRADHSGPND